MLELCALPSVLSKPVQRRKILFSTEAIPDFNALPLQARLACFFLFCLPLSFLTDFSLRGGETGFLSCGFITSLRFVHNCPTRLQRGGEPASLVSFPTWLSKPHTGAHRAEFVLSVFS